MKPLTLAAVHFHVCVLNGVFEEVTSGADADADAKPQAVAADQSSLSTVIFHPARAIDETASAQVQATLRRRILRAFVGRGLLESFEAKEMLAYKHSGFSVDTSVRIQAHDHAGLERLLRYCARPPFATERLRKAGDDLVYRCAKQHSEPSGDWRTDQRGVNKRGSNTDEITLTPLELIDRIAALIPPPRTHRHRYYGALAPNSPLRAAVTAMAMPVQPTPICQPAVLPKQNAAGEGAAGVATGTAAPLSTASEQPEPVPLKRSPAHYLWAALIARIYEVFPLLCPICGGQMQMQSLSSPTAPISGRYSITSG
jgi:Putative transposase